MGQNELPSIRHMQHGSWFWIDKAVIRVYAPKIGALGIAVYSYLASLADADQSCYPSQQHIGEVLGYSRTTINRVIKKLERHRLIAVDKVGRYQQSYRLLDVRCSTDALQVLSTCTQGVRPEHTNKNKLTRHTNNKEDTAPVIHNGSAMYAGLEPVIGVEPLALDIAKGLDDERNLGTYLFYVRTYPNSVLRRALRQARQTPDAKIRHSRAALFKHLVRIYAEQSTHNPGDQPRH